MQPDVTVVIPTYNRMDFLKQAIASCFEGNESIFVEVIVVDDGSTDATVEYLKNLNDSRVRWFGQSHQGAQVARNLGLREARGKYIKFLDDDDWLANGRLVQEFQHLNATTCNLASGGFTLVSEIGEAIKYVPGPVDADALPELLKGISTTHPLRFLIKNDLARQVTWDIALPLKQDLDYYLRISMRTFNHVKNSSNVAFMRTHSGARVSNRKDDVHHLYHLAVLSAVAQEFIATKSFQTTDRTEAFSEVIWQQSRICAILDWKVLIPAWRLISKLNKRPYLPDRKNIFLRMCDKFLGGCQTELILLLPRKIKLLLKWH